MGYKPLSDRESVRNDDDCDNNGRRVHQSGSSSESQKNESSYKYRKVKHSTRHHSSYDSEEEVVEVEKQSSSSSTKKTSSYSDNTDSGRRRNKPPPRKLGCSTGYDNNSSTGRRKKLGCTTGSDNNSSTGRPKKSNTVYEISGGAYADNVADDYDPSGNAYADDVADDYIPPRRVVMRSGDFELQENTTVRGIKHFSHKDPLGRHDVGPEDEIYCDVCEIEISGKCYGCKDCGFFLHKPCSRLPREIRRDSHPDHTLELLASPTPYECVACRETGYGFVYHCSICKFDLDVICAGSPSTLPCEGHDNELKLRYEFPVDSPESDTCKICDEEINQDVWVYFNDETCYIAHKDCAFNKEPEDMVMSLENRLVDMELE